MRTLIAALMVTSFATSWAIASERMTLGQYFKTRAIKDAQVTGYVIGAHMNGSVSQACVGIGFILAEVVSITHLAQALEDEQAIKLAVKAQSLAHFDSYCGGKAQPGHPPLKTKAQVVKKLDELSAALVNLASYANQKY